MAVVRAFSVFGGGKSWAQALLSTAANGLDNADVVDLAGGVPCAFELSTNSTDANYTLLGSIDSSTAMRAILGTTGNELTLGTTAAGNTSGRIVTIDPNLLEGFRFLQVRSGTIAAPIPNATGSFVKVYVSDRLGAG
jgi:hypothetical protein